MNYSLYQDLKNKGLNIEYISAPQHCHFYDFASLINYFQDSFEFKPGCIENKEEKGKDVLIIHGAGINIIINNNKNEKGTLEKREVTFESTEFAYPESGWFSITMDDNGIIGKKMTDKGLFNFDAVDTTLSYSDTTFIIPNTIPDETRKTQLSEDKYYNYPYHSFKNIIFGVSYYDKEAVNEAWRLKQKPNSSNGISPDLSVSYVYDCAEQDSRNDDLPMLVRKTIEPDFHLLISKICNGQFDRSFEHAIEYTNERNMFLKKKEAINMARTRYEEKSPLYRLFHKSIDKIDTESMTTEQIEHLYPDKTRGK